MALLRKFLLSPECLDQGSSNGTTHVHMAARTGKLEALQLLLSARADVGKATTHEGKTPS